VEFEVLETVSDVNAAEFVTSLSVEELEAGPHQGAHEHVLVTTVELQVPGALGHVRGCRVQEVLVERGGGEVEVGFLLGALHVSEVQVALEVGGVVSF